VHGALEAAARGVEVVLVGDRAVLEPMLEAAGVTIELVHAPQVITMAENPGKALREKRDSSIAVSARLVAEGKVAGMVSAGSTGAVMAAAVLEIGRLPGIDRPAIAAVFPVGVKGKVLLDVGANPECKPEHLLQFAVMGHALAQARLGIDQPRVGLLSIGEEPGKGRALERAAHDLLGWGPFDFIGNVEGRDLASEAADVIVTDGFTGNVLLKASETFASWLISEVGGTLTALVAEDPTLGDRLLPEFRNLKRRMNPELVGGASLLGVKGVVTIAHGSASRLAIASALEMTSREADHDLVSKIQAGLRK